MNTQTLDVALEKQLGVLPNICQADLLLDSGFHPVHHAARGFRRNGRKRIPPFVTPAPIFIGIDSSRSPVRNDTTEAPHINSMMSLLLT
jgi:hypothetical protein